MDKRRLSAGADLLRLSTLGINFSLSIFVGLGLGLLVKKVFRVEGAWPVIAGLLLGIVSSYYTLIRDLKALRPGEKKGPPAP